MDLIDQRRGATVFVVADRFPFALIPGTQLDGAAGAFLGLGVGVGLFALVVRFPVVLGEPAGAEEDLVAVGEVVVGAVARDGVEDAGTDRGGAHAELVSVEDGVGRDVVQAARGGLVAAVAGQDAANGEIDDVLVPLTQGAPLGPLLDRLDRLATDFFF